MRNTFTLSVILLSIVGLFSFTNTNKLESNHTDHSAILGMILLEDEDSFNIEKAVSDLNTTWKLEVEAEELKKEASVLEINGYNIAIALISAPIPGDEIESTAAYNYFWKNGAKEAGKHKGHIILSVMDAGKNPIAENLLFNQVAASILKNSKSLGVYIGGRTLLLEKEFYLNNSEGMSADDLPLYNWIYFGLRQEKGKQSIYTYGLSDFGKMEMEIVNTKKKLDDISEMMYNMTHYVIAQDVILNHGETIGMSATQKLKIKKSKGVYLDGKTLKIDY